ncbi:MAG: hypothetical protein K6C34_02335 [Alphaproteobacteria bacterium]|nr:hypothetical protein [Alphaproteobacteria bacterium]
MARKKTTDEKPKSEVKPETKTSTKVAEPSKQSCSCVICCVTTAVIVAVICCVASYFVCEKVHQDYANVIEQKISANVSVSNEELVSLKNEIVNLKKEIDECKTAKQIQYDNSKLRTKWKAWFALRNKIEAGEAVDEELKRVKEVFADDAELLQKINDLLSDAEKNADVIPENIRKYVDKFVALKHVDSKKVSDIDGYVLSSGCNGEGK